jgi:hypothetical protein
MGGTDDALADFYVEAELARELAELPDDWMPDAVEASHSYCSSSAVAGGIANRENPASPAGSSAGQDHSGEQLRPLHAAVLCQFIDRTPAIAANTICRHMSDLRRCTAVWQCTLLT